MYYIDVKSICSPKNGMNLTFGSGMTLHNGNRGYFYKRLDEHFPEMKQQYMHAFGSSYGIHSPNVKVLGKQVKD